jgi:DNA/RNA-binding domain of Phe-tRNA-synthetase-like protein
VVPPFSKRVAHIVQLEKFKNLSNIYLALDNVANPPSHAELNRQKTELEAALRAEFAGFSRQDLTALPAIAPYHAYYKGFKKTYHVLQQLESVAFKGKPIPQTAALVEAMFMAELKNQLLTAGHDLDVVQDPIGVDVARGGEQYTGINGRVLEAKQGDMVIADAAGIISSIVYGPDQRTQIRPETRRVLFTVYAPAAITHLQLATHLEDLTVNVRVFSPDAMVVAAMVVAAE